MSPLPFLKVKKSVQTLFKKGSDCVHLWVKFSIQNVVLRVSRRSKFQIVSLWGLFSGVFDKIYIEVP